MHLVLYCLLAASAPIGWLILVLYRSSRKAAVRRVAERELVHSAVSGMRAEIRGLRTRLDELDQIQTERQAALAPQASINLTKRGQILRMFRRGETPEHISAALNLPSNEVNLTLKIHRMLVDGAA